MSLVSDSSSAALRPNGLRWLRVKPAASSARRWVSPRRHLSLFSSLPTPLACCSCTSKDLRKDDRPSRAAQGDRPVAPPQQHCAQPLRQPAQGHPQLHGPAGHDLARRRSSPPFALPLRRGQRLGLPVQRRPQARRRAVRRRAADAHDPQDGARQGRARPRLGPAVRPLARPPRVARLAPQVHARRLRAGVRQLRGPPSRGQHRRVGQGVPAPPRPGRLRHRRAVQLSVVVRPVGARGLQGRPDQDGRARHARRRPRARPVRVGHDAPGRASPSRHVHDQRRPEPVRHVDAGRAHARRLRGVPQARHHRRRGLALPYFVVPRLRDHARAGRADAHERRRVPQDARAVVPQVRLRGPRHPPRLVLQDARTRFSPRVLRRQPGLHRAPPACDRGRVADAQRLVDGHRLAAPPHVGPGRLPPVALEPARLVRAAPQHHVRRPRQALRRAAGRQVRERRPGLRGRRPVPEGDRPGDDQARPGAGRLFRPSCRWHVPLDQVLPFGRASVPRAADLAARGPGECLHGRDVEGARRQPCSAYARLVLRHPCGQVDHLAARRRAGRRLLPLRLLVQRPRRDGGGHPARRGGREQAVGVLDEHEGA